MAVTFTTKITEATFVLIIFAVLLRKIVSNGV